MDWGGGAGVNHGHSRDPACPGPRCRVDTLSFISGTGEPPAAAEEQKTR